MNRCVAIHSNGTSEVLDVQPRTHRELRGLGYRRFVIRTADGRSPMTSVIYCRIAPSTWQISDAARKLWGRNTTAVQVFDDQGEPLAHDGIAPMTTGEMRAIDAPVAERATPAASAVAFVPASPAGSEPVMQPRLDTQVDGAVILEDVRRAAREIRGLLASRPVSLAEANSLRALADRLEAHARTLQSVLPAARPSR